MSKKFIYMILLAFEVKTSCCQRFFRQFAAAGKQFWPLSSGYPDR
jgi:hypothetical protein